MTEQQKTVYRALSIAAEQIGVNNHNAQVIQHRNAGKSMKSFQFAITPAHQAIVDAMPQLARGQITLDHAMGLLHMPEVFRERFPR